MLHFGVHRRRRGGGESSRTQQAGVSQASQHLKRAVGYNAEGNTLTAGEAGEQARGKINKGGENIRKLWVAIHGLLARKGCCSSWR